ncbi:hypothetical protein ACFV4M_25360 [Kitasatospora indigofera]|uniref:hypothetical protein n=1 Tax=Kitasatospora indigofera TaxID=67307 RepID=UPI00364A1220
MLPSDPSPVLGWHVAQAAATPDRTTWEQDEVEKWSPWRNGKRYVCRSGRYGNGKRPGEH